ncbi:SH3 domain-containing protein [Clostridium sp. ZBS2]|uniref:SH3 domain-containing protein n=1 Tax=Clostridium sp. ZBS2 TaxID=2949976 RepID=UPI002079F9D7|nr:SH3 domain-containing protein [Clostridium sp. ZBS2]
MQSDNDKNEIEKLKTIKSELKTVNYNSSELDVNKSISSLLERPKYMDSISKITKISSRAFNYSESISSILERPKYMDSISKITKISSKAFNYSESISSILEKPKYMDSISKIMKISSKAFDYNKSISSILEKPKCMDSISKIMNINSKAFDYNKSISSILEKPKYMDSISKIMKISSKAFDYNVFEEISKIDFNSVHLNTNGTISYLDKTINIEDEIIEPIDEINLDNNDILYEQKLYSLFTKIKIKHPIVIFITLMFLINPFYEYYIDHAKTIIDNKMKEIEISYNTSTEKHKIIKEIKKEISAEVNLNYCKNNNFKKALNEYRFVKVECLNVRTSNSINSRSIYDLRFGEVVKILKKNKNWSLIEYIVDENVVIKGWVYTRYIGEFK